MYMFLFKRLYSGIYMNWPNQRKKAINSLQKMCDEEKFSSLADLTNPATDQDGPYV